MKILQVNATSGVASTGKICESIGEILDSYDYQNLILYSLYSSSNTSSVKFSSIYHTKINALKSRIFGNYGFNSKTTTKKLIEKIEEFNPDIIHLHNIHSHDINLEMFFKTVKENKYKLFWTFHDCWAFTGYCTYFTMASCDRWKTECRKCPQRKQYSWFFDRSKHLFNKKKRLFDSLDLHIITPSQWLADLVKQSFLKDYPVRVINNGIDLEIFKPAPSDFCEKYNINDKFIILGVAFGWEKRKGLDVFIELSNRLCKNKYQIVLVGTNENVDKLLPDNIISIHRTQNQAELAKIYTAADLFVNPTREENYPTVNMESISCGTPVLTFRTGGSPEILDENTGVVVDYGDIDAMEREIIRIYKDRPYTLESCLERAKTFDMNNKFEEYVKEYGKE